MKLPAEEFLRRYLQHVLPEGFHKVRYFGLWSPTNRKELRAVQEQLATGQREEQQPAPVATTGRMCPCCGKGVMVVIEVLPRRARSPPGGTALQLVGRKQ
ncbi:MAG: transposase [Steroidobacteraceae bacterium]|nr:transposase [Deltaproteobacteria bacterium]